jgi:transposase
MHQIGATVNKKIVLLGVDLSKSNFQCHGINAEGQCVYRKKLTRTKLFEFVSNLPQCTIVTEACGGAHYFARKFQEFGHEAKLIAPQYVKPFVKSNKDDAADAEAIVEASLRPNMHFVSIKEPWQQDLQSFHRVRGRLIRDKTALTNEIRGLLFEYGITIARGDTALIEKLRELLAGESNEISQSIKDLIQDMLSELFKTKEKISEYEKKLEQLTKGQKSFNHLNSIRGLGLISISALMIALADPKIFKNGRHFSAWLGLVPKHSGTGGVNRNMGISKRGDSYIRGLLIHGARAAIRATNIKAEKKLVQLQPLEKWIYKMYQKKGMNKASVALANKNARIAWALVANDREYDETLTSGFPNKEAA